MPTLIGEKRDGSARIRTRRGMPVFEESYSYLVQADSIYQSRDEILLTSGLPQINLTTSAGGFAVCVGLNATRREGKATYWDVTAEFSSEIDEQSTGSTNPGANPPETWIPIYETKFERYQKVVVEDESGNKFVNSAGDPFETGLTVTRHIPIWEFFQFEPASVTDETIIDRSEKVNSTEFRGRPEKTLLCVVLSSVVGRYYGQLRRLTQYQLKYNVDDWRLKMLDVGNRHLNAAGTATVPYNAKILASGGYTADNLEVILGNLDGAGEPAGGFDGATDFAVLDGTEPAILYFDQYASPSHNTFLRR
jgi:hypothetical protein